MPLYFIFATMSHRKHNLHLFVHLLMAAILLVKGYDKFQHHQLIGALTFLFGLIILAYFFYMVFTRSKHLTLEISAHLFEALVAFFTAYIFFTEGKQYIQYISILAGIGFLIAAFVEFRKSRRADVSPILKN